MTSEKAALLGIGTALVADTLFMLTPGHETLRMRLVAEKHPLAFIDHHHWGMAAIDLGLVFPSWSAFLNGLGGTLIASEGFQDHPFGIGKTEAEVKGNIVLTSILGGVLIALLGV